MDICKERIYDAIKSIYIDGRWPTGGPLHTVLNDGNVKAPDIVWCIMSSIPNVFPDDCQERDTFEQCAVSLLQLPLDERWDVICEGMRKVRAE